MKRSGGRAVGRMVTASTVMFLSPAVRLPAQQSVFTEPRGATRTIDFTTTEGTFISLDVSPDGRWIAFDLLGHIYTMPAGGGAARAITQSSGVALNFDPAISPDGRSIAFISDRRGQNNVWVMRADGTGARIVLADPDTRFTDPAWAPDGKSLVAVRVYPTPGRGWHRQTTTLWRLPLDGSAPTELLAGRLMHYDAPAFSPDGRFLYFHVSYSTGDGLGLLTAGHRIQRLELATGRVTNVRSGEPAELSPQFINALRSAAYAGDAEGDEPAALTPQVSPDGARLAFAREMPGEAMIWRGHAFEPRTALFVRDLATGVERKVLDPAAKDLTQVNAQYGYRPFPAYAWSRDGSALYAWEGGKIRRVEIATGVVTTVPFTARVHRVISEQTRSHVAVDDAALESRFIQWPVASPDGRTLAFVAAGRVWTLPFDGRSQPTELSPADGDEVQLTPAWSGDGSRIAFTTWSPRRRGSVVIAPASLASATRLNLPPGEYLYPVWMPDGSGLAVASGPGPSAASWNGWDAPAGWQVTRFAVSGGAGTRLAALGGPTRFAFDDKARLVFAAEGNKAGLYHPFPTDSALAQETVIRAITGGGQTSELLRFPARLIGSEPVLSPDGRWVAFQSGRDLYASPVAPGQPADVVTDPNVEVPGRVRITTRGGIYHSWRDARTLQFASGNQYGTWDARTGVTTLVPVRVRIPKPRVGRAIALTNARIVTADRDHVIERGTVLVRGERIACVGACDLASADTTIDLAGRTIIPGLVDLHAHHTRERSEVVPSARVPSAKALAWGVTSILDPAASSESVFPLAELQAAGRLVGPRVFTTTELLIHPGVAWGDQVIIRSPADAANEVNRRADWGAVSIKNFRQSRREQHQWLLDAARTRGITVTSEGGPLYFDVGLTMDGQTGWEHLIATLPVFSDAAQFFGRAGMVYSPTSIVAGHVNGSMRYYRSRQRLAQDPKFRRFGTAADLARVSRDTATLPLTEFSFPIIAEGLADIMRAGGRGAIGEHGEETGIGEHWEVWAYAEALTPLEAIRAATIDGAWFMGLDRELGSITTGKLADLVVLDGNPLADIRQTANIAFVMQGGRLYDDDTLDQLWPARRPYGTVPWSAGAAADDSVRLAARARQVTIYRDRWGVAHAWGPTDADAVFASTYARAEDRFPEQEPFFWQALGRSAEAVGPDGAHWDALIKALEVERLSQEEYAAAPPEIRALAEAFADGMNWYLRTHPEVQPKVLTRFEPWQVFALYRSLGIQLDQTGVNLRELAQVVWPPKPNEPDGSNMWTVAPSRSASGKAMLFLNPHTPMLPVYELHLLSESGWNVTGMNAYAMTVVPVMGHNASLGWALTVNYPDVADAWEETFDDPARPLAYRYGDGYRMAEAWTDSIRVKTATGLETRMLRLRKTHHGPIVAERNGTAIAVRFAGLERGGLLQQWYAMGKARTLDEFRQALAIQGLVYHNVMYADTTGNIFYFYGGTVPRRDPRFDWTKPVDGTDPATDWRGYHAPAELPQVLNPTSGWMQNTNSTPFLVDGGGTLDSTAFPRYMVQEPDNIRARASRRLLSSRPKFSFEQWTAMAFDRHFLAADEQLPRLFREWDAVRTAGNADAAGTRDMVDSLKAWDRAGDTRSVATTWFVLWRELTMPGGGRDTSAAGRVQALATVRQNLERDWGTALVPWGDIARHQRPSERDGQRPADDRASLPLPTANAGQVGSIFTAGGPPAPGTKRRYATAGHGYVSVVEFGHPIRALSIIPYGQSGNPASPHFFDQAPLFVEGRFKPVPFTLDEVRAAAVRSYHPGVP